MHNNNKLEKRAKEKILRNNLASNEVTWQAFPLLDFLNKPVMVLTKLSYWLYRAKKA
jgi:hypothetical protein